MMGFNHTERASRAEARFAAAKASTWAVIALCVAVFAMAMPTIAEAASSKIRAVVNNQAITNNEIGRRAAFLKLRNVKGNRTSQAINELIEEALQMQEARRLRAVASDREVDAAFANFAKSNRLSTKQLGQILSRAGVTTRGFKDYIRAQISWQRVLAARARAEGRGGNTTRDKLAELHSSGKAKPSTTEYLLQQVIFVVPDAKRKRIIGQRRAEARAFRARFRSCDTTKQFAKGLRDVTIRDLGRVLKPELPDRWKKDLERLGAGKTTGVKDTEKGVEFLAVCQARTVSDDKVAALSFAEAGGETGSAKELSDRYMKELREASVIKRR